MLCTCDFYFWAIRNNKVRVWWQHEQQHSTFFGVCILQKDTPISTTWKLGDGKVAKYFNIMPITLLQIENSQAGNSLTLAHSSPSCIETKTKMSFVIKVYTVTRYYVPRLTCFTSVDKCSLFEKKFYPWWQISAKFDCLRAEVFQLNLKCLHVKITIIMVTKMTKLSPK